MEKTISSLNKKAWYRFLKVVYILALVFILTIGIFFVWDENMPKRKVVDNKNTEIICKYGNREIFSAYEKNVYLGISEFENKKLDSYDDEKIIDLCEINKKNIIAQKNIIKQFDGFLAKARADLEADPNNKNAKRFIDDWENDRFNLETGKLKTDAEKKFDEIYGSNVDKVEKIEKQKNRKIKGELIVNDYYDIDFVTKNQGGFLVFLFYSILTIIGVFAVFEIIKRIFYYIVLGSIKPEK